MNRPPRIRERFVVAYHVDGELVAEGYNDPVVVNNRLNLLWEKQADLDARDRRRLRAFLASKLSFFLAHAAA